MRYRRLDPDDDDASDEFRCPGCEVNTGDGRYCAECRAERAEARGKEEGDETQTDNG